MHAFNAPSPVSPFLSKLRLNPYPGHFQPKQTLVTLINHAQPLTSMQNNLSAVLIDPLRAQAGSLPCQKPTPYKVRVVFSKPVHTVRVRGGPLGPNHGSLASSHRECACHPVADPNHLNLSPIISIAAKTGTQVCRVHSMM